MVHKNNFVAAVKVDGKILREYNGEVKIPFGSEYSILLKNLDSRRCVVSVDIDGRSVTDGAIIIDPNSDLELKGALKGVKVNRRFKFIEKTQEISDYRGDRIDDGIIRIEARFEKRVEQVIEKKYTIPWWMEWKPIESQYPPFNSPYDTFSSPYDTLSSPYYTANNLYSCSENSGVLRSTTDEGITVEGNDVDQGFIYGTTEELEDIGTVVTIKLKGVQRKQPIYTTTKLRCSSCGRRFKSNNKFCPNCGTRL